MYSLKRILKAFYWLILGNKAQKRRVKQELARITAQCLGGFVVGEDHKLWLKDREFIDTCKRLSPGNYYSQERKFMLRELVRYVRNLEGAMAECGCYEGASAYFMARELPGIPLHLFDSFEGLSTPSEIDKPAKDDQLPWQEGDLRTSLETLQNNLAEFDNVYIHKGWIPECLNVVAGEKFRFLHIDVDLYQPTYDSLVFFYPRMIPGGIIILDDFGFENCQGAYKATMDFMESKPEMIVHSPTGQGIIIKE